MISEIFYSLTKNICSCRYICIVNYIVLVSLYINIHISFYIFSSLSYTLFLSIYLFKYLSIYLYIHTYISRQWLTKKSKYVVLLFVSVLVFSYLWLCCFGGHWKELKMSQKRIWNARGPQPRGWKKGSTYDERSL